MCSPSGAKFPCSNILIKQGVLGTRKVAVKKLSISGSFSDTLFEDEIKCLMKAKHNNVVRFLAYCADTYRELVLFNGNYVMSVIPQRLLCFEYVSNGNLRQYLKGTNLAAFYFVCSTRKQNNSPYKY